MSDDQRLAPVERRTTRQARARTSGVAAHETIVGAIYGTGDTTDKVPFERLPAQNERKKLATMEVLRANHDVAS